MAISIPILLYHHVSPDREITSEIFEGQMQTLLSDGFRNVSLDEVVQHVQGKQPCAGKAFAVTFDDGYLDNWTHAFPVLQRLQLKATMYLVTKRVESQADLRTAESVRDTRRGERDPGGFLSWQEAVAMASSGLVTFGSHTHSHREWIREDRYNDIEGEMRDSKKMIEDHLGLCHHLAWPWGDYEDAWDVLLHKFGYVSAVRTSSGANAPGTSPYALQRVAVKRPNAVGLLKRLRWHTDSWSADAFGTLYGLDRRLKNRLYPPSPYSHHG